MEKALFERIYRGSFQEFSQELARQMGGEEKKFIITANPEIVMAADTDPAVKALLSRKESVLTPDGISIVKAMGLLGLPAKERITGVDLCPVLFSLAGERGLSCCLLGAKEDVVAALAEKLRAQYPKMKLWYHNGYEGDKNALFAQMAQEKPDLVVVALGVPGQEKLIDLHWDKFQKGIFIGVGGSFDVLSGKRRRAPKLFIKTNTEWLYRLMREPSRLKRFYRSNVKFIGAVKKLTEKDR